METTTAQATRIAESRLQYDAACKRLLSQKSILSWIMKQCVSEFADCEVADIAQYIEGTPEVGEHPMLPDDVAPVIRGAGQEDATLHEGTITYDIRFLATVPGTDERIRLIINVEAQNDYYPGYPLIKRGLYYCSRLISSQYGTDFTASHYEKIKKVYSIWVCVHPPKERQNTITQYSITEKNLVGEMREKPENYDLLSAVMIHLGEPDGENYDGVLQLLDVLFSKSTSLQEKQSVMEKEFQIPMSMEMEKEVSSMCNLSEGIWQGGVKQGLEQGRQQGLEQGRQQGLEQGRQQGLEQGRQQGVEQGRETEKLANIRSLMKTLKLTSMQAMDALQIPESEQGKYLAMLNA